MHGFYITDYMETDRIVAAESWDEAPPNLESNIGENLRKYLFVDIASETGQQ